MNENNKFSNITPEEMWKWHFIEKAYRKIMKIYNFKEVRTSVVQPLSLLEKIYFFMDNLSDNNINDTTILKIGNESSYGLRPDITISIFNEELISKMSDPVNRLFYCGQIFRNLKNNISQHHQFGAEILGIAEPLAEVEIISLAIRVTRELGLKNLQLNVNSYGCPKCRPNFEKALKKFIIKHKNKYCESCVQKIESQNELHKECTSEKCRAINSEAPKITSYLCNDCKNNYTEVKLMLSNLMIDYQEKPHYENNFRYYNRTVFELIAKNGEEEYRLGGGGRYDSLAKHITGNTLPAVGFSLNSFLLLQLLDKLKLLYPPKPEFHVLLYAKNLNLNITFIHIAQDLHDHGINTVFGYTGMKSAQETEIAKKENCQAVLVIEENLLNSGKIKYKDLTKHLVQNIYLQEIIECIDRQRKIYEVEE
ncbi:MAG: ATP phosphoribosyltransferase regulatory subunit [Candidatus Cloacimonetes bacterium]|nr:ATP phosphoribosyltransferase regulatory subunit [Candidatus Cloacimonadota bacterium]